ncbi:hypothetical protein J4E93_010214 [Alternaria ventricosa]|uniref:uncharacterized protein n=1 Tax=Alternaria ventricosa TaxID=1187951 RepID=UPI0020C2DCF1|nr:uncharacterized protein J4E93_010214 [Alternaria ventricosa]KAI4638414.1 hypothetical protein J4E93_010214 [Alternaria ventricosa]
MSKALAKASSLKPEIRLAQAVSEFEAGLTDEQKAKFRALKSQSFSSAPTTSDVMQLTAEIDRNMSGRFGGQCFGPRFTNFLQGVQQFAALGDVVIGGSQSLIACGVWSLVRMSLLSIVNVSNYMDKLSSMFMEIGRSAPRHQEIALLYPRSTKLQTYLSEYFIVVVSLCRHLFKLGNKSALKQFTSSLSDGDLKAFQNDLNTWALSIEKEMQVSEAQESSGFRALSRSMFKSASHYQKLATKNRILNLCSTFDHETAWKQTRKLGTTSKFKDDTPRYQEWRDRSNSCTLVFTGKLGSGKSVLLANIVDDLSLYHQEERTMIAYFFCRPDEPASLKARTIVGSLARQLLQSVLDFSSVAESFVDTKAIDNIEHVLQILFECYPHNRKTYFIIDGLDECHDEEREMLTEAIKKAQTTLKMLICASFRDRSYERLESFAFSFVTPFAVHMPEKNPEIGAFIEAELSRCLETGRLTIGDPALILEIQDALLKGSQGMFLWPSLQIKSLCSMKTDHAIRKALTELPQDLSRTFSRILYFSGRSDQLLQAKTLQVIMAARRPIMIYELREALSVTPGDATWDPSKMLNDVNSALSCCGCLLSVDEEESTVRVVHHSVRYFVLMSFEELEWTTVPVNNVQNALADIVVTYLGYNVFETQLSKGNVRPILAHSAPSVILQSTMEASSARRHLAMKLLASRKQTALDLSKTIAEVRGRPNSEPDVPFKFFDYAKTYWTDDIWYVSSKKDNIFALSVKLIQSRASELKKDSQTVGRCLWAVEFGSLKLVELIFEMYQTSEGGLRFTPLTWAIHARDRKAVLTIIRAGADVSGRRASGVLPPPLNVAVKLGYKDMVELLLNTGKVNLGARDVSGETAIIQAALCGDKDIVELLLRYDKRDVNAQEAKGATALMLAAGNGHKDVVELLTKIGKADPRMEDKKGQTALSYALAQKHREVVAMLKAYVASLEDTPSKVDNLHGSSEDER